MEKSDKTIDLLVAKEDIQTQEELLQKFQNIIDQIKNSFTNIDIKNVTGGMM